MVIVILGILGLMGTQFITTAFKGFFANDTRMELFEEGKTALVRMEREIHNAIPNGVDDDADTSDIEFGIIDEVNMRDHNIFGVYAAGNFPTKILTDRDAAATPQTGWIISVYNRKWADFFSGSRLFVVNNVAANVMDFTPQNIAASSPVRRYYVVDKAIRYHLDGTTLLREEVPVDENGLTTAFVNGNGQPLAKDVTSASFRYSAGTLTRNAVVSIDFTISRDNELVTFHKEIHIRNVP